MNETLRQRLIAILDTETGSTHESEAIADRIIEEVIGPALDNTKHGACTLPCLGTVN